MRISSSKAEDKNDVQGVVGTQQKRVSRQHHNEALPLAANAPVHTVVVLVESKK